jgi:serine/threonine protein kinase/tetratricopeptide (TPR) repeat protein
MHGKNPAFEPGSVFQGRYEVLSRLGEGGFGVVYKARLLSTGQLVALKTAQKPEPDADPRAATRVARFLRESRLCARLYHPNIVQVMDAGQTEDSLFTVFAFAPGENLATVLATEGALAPREARHLMTQVLDALVCAHSEGVVHRDLKPSNIMVTATGGRRNALVLDFGIGALCGQFSEDHSKRLTVSTDALGTPGYGAPEQWRGGEVSSCADLFAWGLVFLECLTGQPVYAGSSQAEIIFKQLGPDPVPLPAALVDHPVGAILRRATEKDVAARSATANELLTALENVDFAGLSRERILSRKSGESPITPKPGVDTLVGEGESGPAPLTAGKDRRQVTALCCRVDTFASEGKGIGTEELDQLLSDSARAFSDVVLAHKGRPAAILGDELLYYFGLPRAEEDDAKRAGRAALAIVKTVAKENARLAVRGVRIGVHVGIHTGLVVTNDLSKTQGGGPLVGGTPRLASRLASLASAGTVLVSAESQGVLRGSFELDEVESRSVEGIPWETRFFLLKQERSAESIGTSVTGARAKLVGRTHELQMLLECWHRARAGTGNCSVIVGEPGIGKSRLVSELLGGIATEDHSLIEVRCSPDTQNYALFPIVELVEQAFGFERNGDPTLQAARLEALLASYGLDLQETMPLFLDLCSLPVTSPYVALDVSAKKQFDLTFDAIFALLCAMAERRPLLLLIGDLHWADPTTIEVLTHLVREVPSAPICLVMTARPELSLPFVTVGVLQLQRLAPSEVQSMVADLVDRKEIAQTAVEEVVKRADGIPLFVEELTRTMIETGVLRWKPWEGFHAIPRSGSAGLSPATPTRLEKRDGQYEIALPISDVAMPSTLRALLSARLDRLGSAKETAQIAAALGREFSIEVLTSVSSSPPDVVEQDLRTLATAGLCTRGHRLTDRLGKFKHALVRDAAYDSLARPARQNVHARIATVLEERFPDLTRARPDLLAHHNEAAGRTEQAVPYAQQAAGQALKRSAYPEALLHSTKIVEWAQTLTSAYATSSILAANGVRVQALMATRGWVDPEIKTIAEESFSLVQRSGPSEPNKVSLLGALFQYHHTACHHAEALAVADELVATAKSLCDQGLLAWAATARGAALFAHGNFREAADELKKAIAVYEQQAKAQVQLDTRFGMDSLVLAKGILAHICWFEDQEALAFDLASTAVEWARQFGHVPSLGMGLLYAAQVHQHAGDQARTATLTGELLMLAGKYGLPAYEGYAALLHAWANNSEDNVDFILGTLERLGCVLGLSYYASLLAENLAARGELEAAISRIDSCIALCEKNDEHYYEPSLHWRKARYQIQRGDAGDAVRNSLEEAVALARQYGAPRIERLARAEIAERFGEEECAPALDAAELG